MLRRWLFGTFVAAALLAGSTSAEPGQVRLPPPPAGLPAPPPLPRLRVTTSRHRVRHVRRTRRRVVVVRRSPVRHHVRHTRYVVRRHS
jgi:hypothetical protein